MANQEVDNRIVEMQFDAKDFDKNIRKSQKNLEDFKQALNFADAAKQMQQVAESTSPVTNAIMGMAQNVKNLSKEFLGIGRLSTYIAKKVKNAWQGALGSIERFAKSLSTAQVGVGKDKYEGLLRSVQTIKNATGDTEEYVYGVMDKLLKYTDQTSYNFADMTTNIGKFTTAGIKLEDAEMEMEGIANWAALAGQGVQQAERAMYNISQAMSAGYMQKIDWKSIQNASMDIREFRQAALDAAVAAGTLKKTNDGMYKTVKGNKNVNLDNFVETLQFKWFDKKTMEAVFKEFGDQSTELGKKAYKAAQRCVTFSDVINAWKDMLSTGWMQTYQNIFGKLSDAMALFSGLCDKAGESLGKLGEIRNGILESWNSVGGRNALWGGLFGEMETPDGEVLFAGAYGLLDALRDIGEAIRQAFWDFVGEFIDPASKSLFESDKEGQGMAFLSAKLTELTKNFQAFTAKIKDFLFTAGEGETETRFDRIKNAAKAVFAVFTLVFNVFKGIGQFVGELLTQLHPAIYAIESLVDGLLTMFTGKVVNGAKNNTIGNFFHTLAEILKPVTTVINVVIKALASFIYQIVDMASKSGILKTLGDVLKSVFGTLSGWIMKALNSGAMQSIFTWVQNAISKIPELVTKIKAFAAVLGTTFRNSKAFKSISEFFKNTFNSKNLKSTLSSIKSFTGKISQKIPELIGKAFGGMSGGLGDAFATIFGVGTAKAEGAGTTVTEVLADAIAKPIEELGKGNVINQALDKAKPGLLSNIKTKFTEIWQTISGFFTNIANSEGIQKIKKFFEGTNFQNLLSGSTQLIKWLAIFRTGSGMVSIGKGAKSLGKGLKVIGKNFKNLNLSSLSNMFSNMFNLSNIINSNNSDNSIRKSFDFGKLGNQLLQIGLAIGAVAWAATQISQMNDDQLIRAGESIGIIIGALITAGFLAKKFTGNGGSLLALALGVMILMVPLNILQKKPWDELMDSAAKLAMVIAAIALAGSIAGNVKMKGFVGLALAVNLLLIPLKILSNMSIMGVGPDMTGSLLKAIMAIEALVLTMAIAARIAGGNKMNGMLSLAVGLTLMMIPLKTIANLRLDQVALSVGSLVAILLTISYVVNKTNGAQATKLAGLVGAVTALAFVAWLIGHTIDPGQAAVGFGAILGILLSMSLLIGLAGKIDAAKLKQIRNIFLIFTALVAVIAGAIIVMDQLDIDWTLVAAFLGGVIGLVVALGIIIPILGKMDPKTAAIGIIALAAAVVAIMGAIAIMVPVVLGSVGSAMMNLAAKLKNMATLLRDFFGSMTSISESDVDHAAKIFDMLRMMLLGFSGFSNMEYHIKSVMGQLNYLGAGLDMLFANEARYPDSLEDTKTYKLLNGLLVWGPSIAAFSVGNIAEELLSLGVGIMLFNEAGKDVTTTDPPSLGLLSGIFGQADNIEKFTKLPLDTFAGQMASLGGAMSLYAKGAAEVTGIEGNPPDISHSVEILKAVCSAISGDDGSGEFKIPDNMPDSTKLGLFAGQLEALGNALSTFAVAAKDMETDTTNAIALLNFLAEIGGYITPENLSVVDAFDEVGHANSYGTGGKLNQFALDIGALGTALSSFATNIGGNEAAFNTGLGVLDKFQDLNTKLTKDRLAFVSVFTEAGIHETVLGEFGKDIGALGHALLTFAQDVTMDDGTQADFNYALQALDFLAGIQHRLPDLGGLHALLFGENQTLGQLSTDVTEIGTSLQNFSNSITGDIEGKGKFDVQAVTDAVDFLRSFVQVVGVLNTTIIPEDNPWADTYGTVIQNFTNLMSILNGEWGNESMIDQLAAYAQKITSTFNTIGGIDAQAISTFKDLADGLAKLVTLDASATFTFPGEMISQGIADGIEKGRSLVVATIVSVVQAAIDAGNKTAGIHSPSRIFAQMGEFMDAGLVKGLGQNQGDVENASADMMTSVINNAESMMALISQSMADSIDFQPTVTPVLDLSRVMEAGSTLDSIFDDYSLNLTSALNRASAATNNGPVQVIVQNPTDLSGINAAMTQLQNEILGLQASIANIKIVLNTGVIAGGVTDDVDNNLGRKNLYASRRN